MFRGCKLQAERRGNTAWKKTGKMQWSVLNIVKSIKINDGVQKNKM